MRLLRAHLDTASAVALAMAYLAWIGWTAPDNPGSPVVESVEPEGVLVVASGLAFLLALSLRTRVPLVPLTLAYVVLVVEGRARLDASPVIAVGVLLAAYSVAAWSAGRAALVGALGVGGLT